MNFWGYVVIAAGVLAVFAISVMEHHARMVKIKYTQGHNE